MRTLALALSSCLAPSVALLNFLAGRVGDPWTVDDATWRRLEAVLDSLERPLGPRPRLRRGGPIAALIAWRGFSAIAFPDAIVLTDRACEAPEAEVAQLLMHELAHITQWRALGHSTFALWYLSETLRRGYGANVLEEDARQVETRRLTGVWDAAAPP